MLGATEDRRADPYEQESAQLQRESQVRRILCCLDERELQIVTGRFGLTRGQAPLTLKQVGAVMGVSKERIRQIQTRAMGKLRKAAEEDRVDLDMAIAGPECDPPCQHGANARSRLKSGGRKTNGEIAMELPVRSHSDRFTTPGRYRELETQIRSHIGGSNTPILFIYAFDPRTRLGPFVFVDKTLIPGAPRAVGSRALCRRLP